MMSFHGLTILLSNLAGRPIGFALYYDCWDAKEEWYEIETKGEIYSIDYLIGEPYYIGKGYGKEMIQLLTEKIKQNSTAKSIIVQPDNQNHSSCGVLISNGYIFDKDKNYFTDMKQLIACCGLDCESCDARIATTENNDELREKLPESGVN